MRKIPLGNLNSNNPIKTSVKKYHASVARQSSRERNRLLACKSFAFIHANVHKHCRHFRRNLQVVSMEVLKTKYKKPFDALRQDICKAATAYTRFLVFDGMRIKHKYFDEAVPYIDTAVKQTKRLKQISDAAFQRQDIDEIESLALALRKEIEAALQPFYMGHMCLYVTPECFDDPPKTPEVYNDATACVWRDGTWQLLEDTSKGFLLFVQSKSKEEAAA